MTGAPDLALAFRKGLGGHLKTGPRFILKNVFVQLQVKVSEPIWEVYNKAGEAVAKGFTAVYEPNLSGGEYRIKLSSGLASVENPIHVESGKTLDRAFVLDAGILELTALLPGGKAPSEIGWRLYRREKASEEWVQIANGDDLKQRFVLPGGPYQVRVEIGGTPYLGQTDVFNQPGMTTTTRLVLHSRTTP